MVGRGKHVLLHGTIFAYQPRPLPPAFEAAAEDDGLAASNALYDPAEQWKVRMSADLELTRRLRRDLSGVKTIEHDLHEYINAAQIEHCSHVHALYPVRRAG